MWIYVDLYFFWIADYIQPYQMSYGSMPTEKVPPLNQSKNHSPAFLRSYGWIHRGNWSPKLGSNFLRRRFQWPSAVAPVASDRSAQSAQWEQWAQWAVLLCRTRFDRAWSAHHGVRWRWMAPRSASSSSRDGAILAKLQLGGICRCQTLSNQMCQ